MNLEKGRINPATGKNPLLIIVLLIGPVFPGKYLRL